MKFEFSLKQFSPQGLRLDNSVKETSPERLTRIDIITGIGVTNYRARFGLAAFLGKAGISKSDEQFAIQALRDYAIEIAPKNVRKAAGDEFSWCMFILARFAFAEYSRSAATIATCPSCDGKGLIKSVEEVIVYPGIRRCDDTEVVAPRFRTELVTRQCEVCAGKGRVSVRCSCCKGRGKVLDRKASDKYGTPVLKICGRCSGYGFSTLPSTASYKAIRTRLPKLHVRTWTRNWKPLLDLLVSRCRIEEEKAAAVFGAATR